MAGFGEIGELKVIDVLRRKNMTVYIPLKDKGIDFIAIKKNNFYQIQVKTSKFLKGNYFWFDLHKNSMIYSENTFCVFVCIILSGKKFMGKAINYIVIPSLDIKNWILLKDIVPKQGDENILNIFIYPDPQNKKWKYRNKGKELDLTAYWNNFSYFK